jgi:membrane-associated protein
MSTVVGTLLTFLLLYKYFALAAVVLLGAVALPLPVALLLVASGAFAAQGYLDVRIALSVAVVVNIAGDVAEFALARRYGPSALAFLDFGGNRVVASVEKFIQTYPRTTIFLTRFSGTTGVLANLFAGFTGISYPTFVTFDSLGNVISIAPFIWLGWLVGVYWQQVIPFVDIGGWVALLVVAAVLGFLWWRSYRRR